MLKKKIKYCEVILKVSFEVSQLRRKLYKFMPFNAINSTNQMKKLKLKSLHKTPLNTKKSKRCF